MIFSWNKNAAQFMCVNLKIHKDSVKFVGDAMSAIAASSSVPVSVKCRIGVDDHDSYEELCKA